MSKTVIRYREAYMSNLQTFSAYITFHFFSVVPNEMIPELSAPINEKMCHKNILNKAHILLMCCF